MAASTGVSDDGLLAKIRALLAKAEATEFPSEAETLTAKATELMAKYGIEQAMLADAEPSRDKVTNKILQIDNPYGIDKALLLQYIARPLRCRAIRIGAIRGQRVHLFGFAADIERLEILFTSLLVQSANALAATSTPYGRQAVSFRKSFLAGFSAAVTNRLRAAEQRAQEEAAPSADSGRSVALVLADRSTAVDREVAEEYPDVRTSHRTVGRNGYGEGAAAGNRADIGGTRVGGGRRSLGSAR